MLRDFVDATSSLYRKRYVELAVDFFKTSTSNWRRILLNFCDATSRLYCKIRIALHAGRLYNRISTWICVLWVFLNATSIIYRKGRIGLDIGPLGGSKWRLKGALGPFGRQDLPKRVPGPPPESKNEALRGQNGAVLRLNIESEFVLISGAEKVVHWEAQKVEERSLGTSKTSKIHWRGCHFKVFALFGHGSVLNNVSTSERLMLGAFWHS